MGHSSIAAGIARAIGACALVLALTLTPAGAQEREPGAMARIAGEVALQADGGGVTLRLPLSQPVPWRVRLLDGPARVVLDLNAVDWAGLDRAALSATPAVSDLRAGQLRSGWSRLVIALDAPHRLERADLRSAQDGGAGVLHLRLAPATAAELAALAEDEPAFAARFGAGLLHAEAPRPAPAPAPARPLVVMLDPGHGGIDPGAEREGLRESDLMLSFARELREALLRAGGFEVAMTRDADVFVSLDGRIRAARAAGADVLLSLHADALPDGGAVGATLYTLSDEASDRSAAILAERHDRADLLAGVDLTRAEDAIADVLMSLAQTETKPRTEALSEALIGAIGAAELRLHRRPRQYGAFSVLRAPDIPSVLIELGFMSNPRDLANLQDSAWRARMVAALVSGLQDWAQQDAASEGLRRR